jgi:HAMP domain-containing protein
MTEDKIKDLLKIADQTIGQPVMNPIDVDKIRQRASTRRIAGIAVRIAAVLVLVLALAIWNLSGRNTKPPTSDKQIASVQNQLKQLNATVDATLKLVQDMLETERQQHRLDELQARLANISDPLEEVQKQVDKTAFILVFQADQMQRERGQRASAIRTYNRVIELFPQSHWAEIARQRLSEMRNQQRNKDSKGDLLWKPQNVLSSC